MPLTYPKIQAIKRRVGPTPGYPFIFVGMYTRIDRIIKAVLYSV